jgi:hypothetical protein
MGLKFSVDGRYCLVTNLKMDISLYLTAYLKRNKKIPIHGKSSVLERTLYHTPSPLTLLCILTELYAFIANSNANKIEIIDMKNSQ